MTAKNTSNSVLSRIISFRNGLKRKKFVERKTPEKKQSSLTSKRNGRGKTINLDFLKNINRKIALLLILFIFLFFILFTLLSYFDLKTNPLFSGEPNYVSKNIDNNEQMSVLFFVYQEIQTDSLQKYFIKSINLAYFDFNKGSIKFFNISPLILYSGQSQIYGLLNDFKLADGKIGNLIGELETLFGIVIHKYIAINSEDVDHVENLNLSYVSSAYSAKKLEKKNSQNIIDEAENNRLLFEKFLKGFSLGTFYTGLVSRTYNNFRTDFSKTELVTFLYNLALLDKNIKSLNVANNYGELVNSGIDLDSQEILESIKELFNNIDIIIEQSEVEVYNATVKSGLALKRKRQLNALGINVIRMGNYFEISEFNYLYIPEKNPEKFENTINAIKQIFGNDLIIKTEGYEQNYSGDLILVIGKE